MGGMQTVSAGMQLLNRHLLVFYLYRIVIGTSLCLRVVVTSPFPRIYFNHKLVRTMEYKKFESIECIEKAK